MRKHTHTHTHRKNNSHSPFSPCYFACRRLVFSLYLLPIFFFFMADLLVFCTESLSVVWKQCTTFSYIYCNQTCIDTGSPVRRNCVVYFLSYSFRLHDNRVNIKLILSKGNFHCNPKTPDKSNQFAKQLNQFRKYISHETFHLYTNKKSIGTLISYV